MGPQKEHPSSSLPLLPAHSPCSQVAPLAPRSIPGSLELPWGLRKPPACSPCFQLAPFAPSLLPLLPLLLEHPWVPETYLEPQEASRLLPLLPTCSPHSQLTPLASRVSLGLWNLPGTSGSPQLAPLLPEYAWVPGTFLGPQKAPSSLLLLTACSPHSQLAPLAPRASLGFWNLLGASGSPQLALLTPSSLPLLPENPWIPAASWDQGEHAGAS